MQKSKRNIMVQAIGLVLFCVMAAASSSSSGGSGSSYSGSSNVDWRGAAVGAGAAYNGYVYIGRADSDSEAQNMASNKGYSYYLFDAKNGAVYAK